VRKLPHRRWVGTELTYSLCEGIAIKAVLTWCSANRTKIFTIYESCSAKRLAATMNVQLPFAQEHELSVV
jgi:hypothetical protein